MITEPTRYAGLPPPTAAVRVIEVPDTAPLNVVVVGVGCTVTSRIADPDPSSTDGSSGTNSARYRCTPTLTSPSTRRVAPPDSATTSSARSPS
jgi:hypothetical protein